MFLSELIWCYVDQHGEVPQLVNSFDGYLQFSLHRLKLGFFGFTPGNNLALAGPKSEIRNHEKWPGNPDASPRSPRMRRDAEPVPIVVVPRVRKFASMDPQLESYNLQIRLTEFLSDEIFIHDRSSVSNARH